MSLDHLSNGCIECICNSFFKHVSIDGHLRFFPCFRCFTICLIYLSLPCCIISLELSLKSESTELKGIHGLDLNR